MKTPRADHLITGAGIIMRLYRISHGDAWHDEAFTGLVSVLPWSRFWEALLGDVHPPLWYLVERAFLALLPPGEFALRFPAALCSIAALLLFARLVARSDLPRPGKLAALALMAFSPFQIYYAQEARVYAALLLAAVLLLIAVIERRPWLFAAGAVAAVWLHNLGGVYVLVGAIAVLITDRENIWTRWDAPSVVTFILSAPAIIWTIYQTTRVADGYWIMDAGLGAWLYNTIYCPLLGQGLIDSRLSWNAALVALVVGLGGVGVSIRNRRWVWILMGWGPGLIMLAVSNLVRPLLLARTFIGAAPALYLMAGQLFTTRRRQAVLGLALLPVLFSGLWTHYATFRRGNIGQMADVIRVEQPAVIMHSQTGAWVALSWHMPEARHVLWTGAARGLSNAISDQTSQAFGMERLTLAELERPAAIIFADYALVSPDERVNMLAELEAAGAELTAVLAADSNQRIDLWMLR